MDTHNLSDITKYYRIKMSALSNYSSIVWNRFNWFLTLVIAIFGLYFNKIEQSSSLLFQYGVPIIGVSLSILWLLMGFEDYLALKRHKQKVSELDKYIKHSFQKLDINVNTPKNKRLVNFSQSLLLFIFPMLSMISWIFVYTLYLKTMI